MWRCVNLGLTDVSEERIASIFRIAATYSRWFTLSDVFYPEDGGDTVLRNVG
jgi:hypothetical protein